jgi:hypothetical protein
MKAGQRVQQGRFARAIAADDGDQFAGANVQIGLMNGPNGTVTAAQTDHFQQRFLETVIGEGSIRRHIALRLPR